MKYFHEKMKKPFLTSSQSFWKVFWYFSGPSSETGAETLFAEEKG